MQWGSVAMFDKQLDSYIYIMHIYNSFALHVWF
jgi:hypothetical protein